MVRSSNSSIGFDGVRQESPIELDCIIDKVVKKTRSQDATYEYWAFRFTSSKVRSYQHLVDELNVNWIFAYRFQLERGEGGVDHYQGSFHVKPKKRKGYLQKYFVGCMEELEFPFKDYLEKSKSCAADRYCMKDETRIAGPWEKNMPVLPPPIKILKDEQLYDWQKDLVERLKDEPDDRKIVWLWEPDGCKGKTSIAKYLHVTQKAVYLGGKAADMKHCIVQYIEKNPAPRVVLINIPRASKDFVSYTGIEEIKDGLFFSGKYEGGMVCFNSPHVVVFSNEEPDYSKMSGDRWDVIPLHVSTLNEQWES